MGPSAGRPRPRWPGAGLAAVIVQLTVVFSLLSLTTGQRCETKKDQEGTHQHACTMRHGHLAKGNCSVIRFLHVGARNARVVRS